MVVTLYLVTLKLRLSRQFINRRKLLKVGPIDGYHDGIMPVSHLVLINVKSFQSRWAPQMVPSSSKKDYHPVPM